MALQQELALTGLARPSQPCFSIRRLRCITEGRLCCILMPSAALKGKNSSLALQVQLASCKTLAVQSCCRLFCPHSPHHWPCEPRRGETASDPSLDPSLWQPAASDPIPQGPQGPCFAPAPQQARRRPPPPRRRRGHRLEGRQRQSRRRSASLLRSREYRTRPRSRRRPRSRVRAWSATTRAPRPPRHGKRGTRRFDLPCRLIT